MENKMNFDVIMPLIDEAFEQDEEFTFKPNGVSMLPFIKGGKSHITIKKYTGGAKKYDIIFYRRDDGKYVMHRIIKNCNTVHNDGYGVCGDNQWWIEKVYDNQIFAIVTRVDGRQKNGGFVYLHTLPVRRFIIHVKKYIKKHLGGKRK